MSPKDSTSSRILASHATTGETDSGETEPDAQASEVQA